MRLATWNIGGGFITQNQDLNFDLENLDYFIEELAKITPDIVCLQETHESEHSSQPRKIANALGFSSVVTEATAPSHIKDEERLCISILSRYPLKSSKFNMLPNPNLEFLWKGRKELSHDKGFTEAILNFDGHDIRVLSGHMVPFRKFGRDFMEDDFKHLREKIEEVILGTSFPEVVGADMNWPDIYALIPKVFSSGYSFLLDDIPTTPKERKYDKILASKEWRCSESKIIKGRADHFLCYADLELLS